MLTVEIKQHKVDLNSEPRYLLISDVHRRVRSLASNYITTNRIEVSLILRDLHGDDDKSKAIVVSLDKPYFHVESAFLFCNLLEALTTTYYRGFLATHSLAYYTVKAYVKAEELESCEWFAYLQSEGRNPFAFAKELAIEE